MHGRVNITRLYNAAGTRYSPVHELGGVRQAAQMWASATKASVVIPPWHCNGQTAAQWCALPDPAACLCQSWMPSGPCIAPCTLSSCPRFAGLPLSEPEKTDHLSPSFTSQTEVGPTYNCSITCSFLRSSASSLLTLATALCSGVLKL